MRLLVAAVLFAATASSASASVRMYTPRPHARCRAGYHRERVLVPARHRVRRHHRFIRRHGRFVWRVDRRHGHIVHVRRIRCVHVKTTTTTTAPTPPPTAVPAPTLVQQPTAASLDPSYTQDPNNPLKVTWTYSAADAGTTTAPPLGSLTLTVTQTGQAGQAGQCSMEVGGLNPSSGTCTLTLPAYGDWDVTVAYTGADPATVAPSTQTQTETIEPPAATIQEQWATTPPSNQPTITATVEQQTHVTITDANFEGAASVTVADNLGDQCTAAVSGSTAACSMTAGGTPSSFTISYPGGQTVQTTQTVPPNGIQSVSYVWGADTVHVTNPTVTVQSAPLSWNGWQAAGRGGGNRTAPPDPLAVQAGDEVQLWALAVGSLSSDYNPQGTIDWQVTQAPAGAVYTANDAEPSASPNCSASQENGGLAVGGCYYTFSTPGTYTIEVSFSSQDPNYPSITDGLQETITVS